jgi:hypothetical protein
MTMEMLRAIKIMHPKAIPMEIKKSFYMSAPIPPILPL